MTNYTKNQNFTAKDALTTGDPEKIISGADMDAEFDEIAASSATKANLNVPASANNVALLDGSGDLADGGQGLPSGTLVGTTDAQTLTNKGINSDNNTITNIVNANIKAAAAIDATKIADGTVTNAEFQYLGDVTSAIQAQLTAIKAGTSMGTGSITSTHILNGTIASADFAAGAVDQTAIGASAVGQGELKTTTGEVSGTDGATVTAPGGAFSFFLRYRVSSNTGYWSPWYGSSTSAASTTLLLSNSVSGTTYAYSTYIQASPPYDLGDGEVPRFIFANVIANKTIKAVYSAEDAPWHYSGPTSLRYDHMDNLGRKFKRRKNMSSFDLTKDEAIKAGRLSEYIQAFHEAEELLEEITQETKQKDMGIIPHPFLVGSGETVVLLDPVNDETHKLAEMCSKYDEFSINELLHEGYLEISNEQINRKGPPGVQVVSYKWRNTK